jgi:hypothetical protein
MTPRPRLDRQLTEQERIVSKLVRDTVRAWGSEEDFARACGVSQQTISKACVQGRVTVELALRMHKATGGRLDRLRVCPILVELLP